MHLTATQAATSRLEAIGISKSFARLHVLKNVSLEVSPNELVAVVGPSGVGKTTLLRILAGHLPADRGFVRVNGNDITAPSPRQIFVTQVDALLPNRTVIENLLFPAELTALRFRPWAKFLFAPALAIRTLRRRYLAALVGNDALSTAHAMLDQFQLAAFESMFPYQLSAGMRKRIELLRALMMRPAYLILDEPFAHVDPLNREPLLAELRSLMETTAVGIILVTHDWLEAALTADKVIVLAGRPAEIVASFEIHATTEDRASADSKLIEIAVQIKETLKKHAKI